MYNFYDFLFERILTTALDQHQQCFDKILLVESIWSEKIIIIFFYNK